MVLVRLLLEKLVRQASAVSNRPRRKFKMGIEKVHRHLYRFTVLEPYRS